MSLHRAALFAVTALFTAGMTSIASAGCCGWGFSAPIAYVPAGCGGCGTAAAVVYAQPVAPAPVVVSTWNTGCGCQPPVVYAPPALVATPIAPAPIYLVNQGPDYVGPGLMVPYRTWSPAVAYAVSGYPYLAGYGYGVRRVYVPARRIAYPARFYVHPHYYGPQPRWRP